MQPGEVLWSRSEAEGAVILLVHLENTEGLLASQPGDEGAVIQRKVSQCKEEAADRTLPP